MLASSSLRYITKVSFRSVLVTGLVMNLANSLQYFVEGFFVGQFLSTTDMSILGICLTYVPFIKIVGSLFMVGTQIVIVKLVARAKLKEAQQTFFTVCFICLIFSVCITVLIIVFSDVIVFIGGARDDAANLQPLCSTYVKINALCTIPEIFIMIFCPVAQLNNKKIFVNLYSILNVVMLAIFYYVVLVVLKLDILACAYGSVIVDYLAIIFVIFAFVGKNIIFTLKPQKLNFTHLLHVFKLGIPDIVLCILRLLKIISFNTILLAAGGVIGLTAVTIYFNFSNILFAVNSAIGAATLMLSSVYFGEKDSRELRNTIAYAKRCAMCIVIPFSVVLFIFSEQLVCLYSKDMAVIVLATNALRCASIGLLFECLTRLAVKTSTATNHPIIASIMNVLQLFLYPTLFAFLLVNTFGLDYVFLCFIIAPICCILTFVVLIRVQDKIAPKEKSYMQVIKAFDVQIYRSTVSNKDDVVRLIQEIEKYLVKNKVKNIKRYKIELCIEELVYNILRYPQVDRSNFYADLRLIIDADNLIIRIRDNCTISETVYIREICTNLSPGNDFYTNIGVRVLFNMASDIQYSQAIKFNNLMISLGLN